MEQQAAGNQGGSEGRGARFQVSIDLPAGASIPEKLDLDVVPTPSALEGKGDGIVAVASLDDVERLVAAGARVTVERAIGDVFPPDLVMSDKEARARLERLANLREEGER